MSWLIPMILAGALFASADTNNLTTVNVSRAGATENATVQTDETERFEQTYPLSAAGRVSVSNINGSITIDVWDSPQVKLEYVKTASSREILADAKVKIDARQDSLRVETDIDDLKRAGDDRRWRSGEKLRVEYRLIVPRTAILDEIETVNGSVNISNAGNLTKASTVNGELNATNLRGAAADLSTVNGAVNADFDSLQTGSRISLNAVNGQVTLTVPSDASATVKADTLNGSITNDFNLPVRKGEFVGRDLYGKIGAGDARIKLSSVNGNLYLRRKNDGKTLSAPTNLLTSKSYEDDEDFDGDRDRSNTPRVKPPKPPKPPRISSAPPAQPAPNVVIDNEAIRKSIEDAQKEVSRIQPELSKINAEALRQAAAEINSPQIQAQLRAAQDKYSEAMARMMNANWGAPRVEEKSESFNVKGTPRVTVEAGNCAVVVRGTDKQEVRYSATRVAKTQAPLDVRATLENNSNVVIKVLNGDDKSGSAPYKALFGGSPRVRIEIFVPRKTDLKIKTSGEIRLENVSGEIDLQGADESINVRDTDGKLSVETNDGAIRVIGFRGSLISKTSDGTMNLEGGFAALDAAAENDGAIVLTLPENANARLETNSEIESEGGVNLIRENGRENSWRIGKGGALYRLSAADGKILVRGADALKAIF